MSTLRVTVSGVTYTCAIECSSVPEEGGWPTPTVRKAGKGYQWVYECTPDVAADILWHLEQLGSGFAAGGGDDEMGRDGRACLKDAHRIEMQLIPLVKAGRMYRARNGYHTTKEQS